VKLTARKQSFLPAKAAAAPKNKLRTISTELSDLFDTKGLAGGDKSRPYALD